MSNRGGYRGTPHRGGGGFQGNRGGPPRGASPSGGPPQRGGSQQFRGGRPSAGPTGAVASGDQKIFGSPAPVDERLRSSGELVKTLKNLPYNAERPSRPGFGTLGTKITLRANFFPVKFERQILYDYAISVSPTKLFRKRREALFTLLEQSQDPKWRPYASHVVHDKNARLISAKKLPQSMEVPVLFLEGNDSETYTFSFELTNELDTEELIK